MNIFATSGSPSKAAQHLDDKRLLKMTVETAQILSTAARVELGETGPKVPEVDTDPTLYRAYCYGGRHSEWARASQENFLWLMEYGEALVKEKEFRGFSVGKAAEIIKNAGEYLPLFPDVPGTPFAADKRTSNIMREFNMGVSEAYRFLLCEEKWPSAKGPLKWTKRGAPKFYLN